MSSTGFAQRLAGISKALTAFVVLALLVAVALVFTSDDGKRYITVDFEQTNSVYEGSDVKILGVTVGEVETLTPRGNVVRAKISYGGDYRLPSDVKAVVVSPSIVGDRFVQFSPAYNGGASMKDRAFLPINRTAVPVELDAVYQSLDDLSTALGPKGANKEGALSSLLDDTAKQLDGQGAQVNETIKNFSKLSTTLSNNKDELFGSLREVGEFVTLLKTNDSAVRSFNDSTSEVSTVLAGERKDLEATLKALSLALVDVNSLVKDNRGKLKSNIDNISVLASTLAKHEKDIEKFTKSAPTALSNVSLAYNGKSGTLDTRADLPALLNESLADPATLLCNFLGESPDDEEGLCFQLTGLLGGLTDNLGKSGTPALPEAPKLPDAPDLPKPRAAAGSGTSPDNVDGSLRDMLAVN